MGAVLYLNSEQELPYFTGTDGGGFLCADAQGQDTWIEICGWTWGGFAPGNYGSKCNTFYELGSTNTPYFSTSTGRYINNSLPFSWQEFAITISAGQLQAAAQHCNANLDGHPFNPAAWELTTVERGFEAGGGGYLYAADYVPDEIVFNYPG